jgi:uncharacterized protein (DUF58 family)
VTRAPAPRLGGYLGLAALGLVAALVLGRPELAALAAPFLLVAAAGAALAREPRVTVSAELDRERALESEEVVLTLAVEARARVERLELLVPLERGLALAEGENPVPLRLRAEEPARVELRLACERFGGYTPGVVHLRARDPLGLFVYESAFDRRRTLRVFPREEVLRRLLRPAETLPFTGSQVARDKGEGAEFADLRAYVPGDRVHRVNWRASARRGELVVDERHPERNADVLLFLDTFAGAGPAGAGTLELAVRAASGLASRYLAQRDRVGLVSFGGILRWLLPATGVVQGYRLLESLIESDVAASYAWKGVDVIPRRVLPAGALVVALTPLLDERSVRALLDLRARRFDVAVVEVSPVPFAPPLAGEQDRLAHRLWLLRRDALRGRFRRLGVPVAEWRDGEPLQAPIAEVASFRRRAAAVRV